MEEYEIRNLYLTPIESSVVYSNIMMAPVLIERGFYIFDLEVHLTNKTRYVSEKYKVCMSFLTDNKQLSIDIKDNIILSRFQEGITISTKDLIPIFPKEVLSVLKCQVLIPVDDFDYAVANLETKLQVFSNHEIEEVNLKLNKVLKFNKEKAFGK